MKMINKHLVLLNAVFASGSHLGADDEGPANCTKKDTVKEFLMTCRRGTKLSLITRAGWIAAAVAVAALQLGAATILPAAISDVELNDQTGYVSSFSPGTYHTPAVHGGAVIGSVLNLSTTPLGSFSIDPYYYSTANVTADYYFEWIGPSGTLVPTDVNVTLDYFATTTTGAQQVASVYVVQKGYTSYDILKQVGPTFGSSSFSGVLTADLLVNTIYDVGLHVEGDGADIDVLTNAISPFWTGPSHGSADPYRS